MGEDAGAAASRLRPPPRPAATEAQPVTRIFLDFETRSEIDIRASGHHAYAEHPSTAVLLLGYAFDADPPALWQPHLGPLPAAVRQALADPAITKVAHNAAFELAILRHVLGIESALEAWRCTAVMGRLNGLPGGLADLGRALGLGAGQAKLASGTRLIHKFSRPQARGPRWRTWETDPQDWRALGEYCLRDVEAERAVYDTLARWMPPAAEWALWRLDQRINQRGLPVDRALVGAAIQIDADYRTRALDRAVTLTGLTNPNSRDQLLEWLNREGEAGLADLRAGSVREAIGQCDDATVREVLQIRQALAKTSVRKYQALARATSGDGRLRGAFLFAGAPRTSRWSGQLFQPQNLPRGSVKDLDTAVSAVQSADAAWVEALYGDVPAVLSACVRPAICAPEGQVLVAADYSSIESVVVAWLAESRYLLALFEAGRDPYKDFATRIFHVSYDAVTKLQRTISKPAVLGASYGLGGPGLQRYAASMGVTLSEAEARTHIATYREAYADVPALWRRLTAGAELALRTRGTAAVGRLAWEYEKPFLFLRLPSGRRLGYYQPKLEARDTPWGEQRITLTYEGQAQATRKWGRIPTHAGKVVENCLAADTEVLTDRGWVPIVEVRATDRLWDGEAWVAHAGVVCQGAQDTIERLGIRATSDHPVLTPDGWAAFGQVPSLKTLSNTYVRRTFTRGMKTHGFAKHPAYWVWRSMIDRCRLSSHHAYHNYGARGISVTPRWHGSFLAFWLDMGPTYRPGLSLERIDNDAGYGPENCRWATPKEQSRNTRRSRFVRTPWGRITVVEASERSGIAVTTLLYRLDRGWPESRLFIPPDPRNCEVIARARAGLRHPRCRTAAAVPHPQRPPEATAAGAQLHPGGGP